MGLCDPIWPGNLHPIIALKVRNHWDLWNPPASTLMTAIGFIYICIYMYTEPVVEAEKYRMRFTKTSCKELLHSENKHWLCKAGHAFVVTDEVPVHTGAMILCSANHEMVKINVCHLKASILTYICALLTSSITNNRDVLRRTIYSQIVYFMWAIIVYQWTFFPCRVKSHGTPSLAILHFRIIP